MKESYEERKIPFGWSILAGLVLWGFFGWLSYMLGLMARAALAG